MGKKVSKKVLYKEIDLIQACITRMATCSFSIKGWYVSLVAIVITLLVGQESQMILIGGFLFCVTSVFWGLDGFFLQMETLYKWKYEWVIEMRQQGNKQYLYDLNPMNKNMWLEADKKNDCIMTYVLSKTLKPIYGIPWMIAVIILVWNIVKILKNV